ncbi:hypothetical protein ATANTOWER_003678 [Ataeniobius toweri]|uniref:Uncharacterized protein n=1 Tax=Ataeniobius toweri TaxID=208326 RepID=A0ABU7B4T4_9TELE|nr:hypothetical protein [Ataeniobius toweri]
MQLPKNSPDSAAALPFSQAHSPSSKLIFISIWCLQPWFQFHYSLLKENKLVKLFSCLLSVSLHVGQNY